jgi:hypothetical protein
MVDFSRLAFRFAETRPETPHEYVVRTTDNEDAYRDLFHTIHREGAFARFGGRRYKYWPHDGYQYWAMTDDLAKSRVINRAKLDDPKLPFEDGS